MIYENDQLTKLIKNTKNDTYLDGMTSDIVVNWLTIRNGPSAFLPFWISSANFENNSVHYIF